MKGIQGSFFSGYVRISIKGESPEKFFQVCNNHNIFVWNIKRESKTKCSGNIKLKDVDLVKQMNRPYRFKVKFTHKKGIPFVINKFFYKKELFTSLILSCLLIVLLSNIVWKIEVSGVPKELEEKINEQLIEYGIHPGALTFNLESPGDIQRQLESDVDDLLWVGVQKKGTTYVLEGVEKVVVEKEKVEGPRNLIASKKGIIKKLYISKGQPLVSVHDYVEPGDVLVSGDLREASPDEKDEKSKKEPIYVAADGEIIADTWYEMDVTVPLISKKEKLTGNSSQSYFLKLNKFNLPIWGFKTPDYKHKKVESKLNPIHFLKWELPISFFNVNIFEKEVLTKKRAEKEAVKLGIEQAKYELRRELGSEATIKSDKILHEAIENGKVRIKLHLSVEENIVQEESITND